MNAPTAVPIPERVKELDSLTIDHGGHGNFEEGHCFNELVSYIAGEPHSARPKCCSPVLAAFTMRLSDSRPLKERQQLKPYLERVVGTAGDGQDEARAWLASDWLIRTALPTWLDLAGAEDSAKALRALPEVTAETIGEARPLVLKIRDAGWERRQAARKELMDKVREAVKKKLTDKGVSNPYAAAYAAADGRYELRKKVRQAVRKAVEEKLEPTKVAILPSALELLDRMIDPKAAA